MVGLTLAPAEIWRAPAADAVYTGFDPNFQFATGGTGGKVNMSRDAVELTAVLPSPSSVNLATTPLRKLNAAVDVTIVHNDSRCSSLSYRYMVAVDEHRLFRRVRSSSHGRDQSRRCYQGQHRRQSVRRPGDQLDPTW